jgi:hypothetical protein
MRLNADGSQTEGWSPGDGRSTAHDMADDLAPDVGHQGEPGDKVPVRAEFVDQYRLGCRFPSQVGPVEGSLMDRRERRRSRSGTPVGSARTSGWSAIGGGVGHLENEGELARAGH